MVIPPRLVQKSTDSTPMHSCRTPIRCAVRITNGVESRSAVASAVTLGGIQLEIPIDGDGTITVGRMVQLDSEAPPLGPIHIAARIASTQSAVDNRGKAVVSAVLQFLDFSESQRQELEGRLQLVRPVVLLVGCEASLDTAKWESVRVIEAATAEEALRYLDKEVVSVFVLGPQLRPDQMQSLLECSIAERPGNSRPNILSGIGAHVEPFQSFIDHDHIFYLARGPLKNVDLWALSLAAATRFAGGRVQASDLLPSETSDRSLEFCARICLQADAANAANLLAEAVRRETAGESAQCFLYDRATHVLTSTDTTRRVEIASAGLVGYVARTGVPVQIEKARDDPRYDAESDNPSGHADVRFLAEPIFARPEIVIGVVTATRPGTAEPFSREDACRVAALAGWAAPSISALLIQEFAQTMLLDRARAAVPNLEIFRPEALDLHTNSGQGEGEVLEGVPAWLRRTHWVTTAFLLISLIYAMVAKVDETTTGPVLVRARSKSALTSTTGGVVRSVEVTAGDHVRSGDLVLEFYDSPTSDSLKSIRGLLRAPKDGLVSDVRVRPGQQISPGEQVASIIDETVGYELNARLLGSYAPQIRPGMSIVFKLDGYPDSHEIGTIDGVRTDNVVPLEAARHSSRENGNALGVAGPALVVHSTLPQRFAVGDRSYPYEDGMTGNGEVRLLSEPLIIEIVPGLKNLLSARK
jgi:hypothetical protein